jgi:ribosomal protein S27AE
MPTFPRVYADFNAIEYERDGSCYARLPLTGYGTLASLSRQKLRITEGLELVLFEPNDIECNARAHFCPNRCGPATIVGEWVAVIQNNDFRDSINNNDIGFQHPCFGCGIDLEKMQPIGWRSYREVCVMCGTSVMAPLAPPESAA